MTGNPFYIDLRALACLRIGIGAILLADLAIRAPDISVFLTDSGFLSRAESREGLSGLRWSLYWLSGHWAWAAFLFACAGLSAIALMMGIRTRLATISSFILIVSLHNRNPMLLQGGDNLLLLLLFWGCMLPWGARYSIDSALSRNKPASNRYTSFATAGLLIQVVGVYFFSALLKSGDAWIKDGTAIYYALHHDQFAIGLAPYWRDWTWLTTPITHYVWWLELLGPLIALSPFFNAKARLLTAFAFISLEIGFIFNLAIGLFPLISISSLLVLLPSTFWDRFSAGKQSETTTLYYDQDCGFCLKSCLIIRHLTLNSGARVLPAQSHAEIGPLLEREFSWVIETPRGRYLRTDALIELIESGGLPSFLAWPLRIFQPACDRLYHWIGQHRSGPGLLNSPLFMLRENTPRPGPVINLYAAVALIWTLWWNLGTIPDWSRIHGISTGLPENQRLHRPDVIFDIRNALRLDQVWNMFAPFPATNDGWFKISGILQDNSLADVLHQKPGAAQSEKPSDFSESQFRSYRWRKYLNRMNRKEHHHRWEGFSRHVCSQWNQGAEPDKQLKLMTVYYYLESTPPPGETATVRKAARWQQDCTRI